MNLDYVHIHMHRYIQEDMQGIHRPRKENQQITKQNPRTPASAGEGRFAPLVLICLHVFEDCPCAVCGFHSYTPPYLFKKSHGFCQGPRFLTKRPSVGRKPELKKLADPVFQYESHGIYGKILRIDFRRNHFF